MDSNTNIIEPLLERVTEYTKTSLELFKLKALEKSSEVVSSVVSRLAVILFVMLFFLLASLGVANLLGDLMGKPWLGFLVVAGFYGLSGLVLQFLLHRWVKARVRNFFINMILK